jgi:hypothetical protein
MPASILPTRSAPTSAAAETCEDRDQGAAEGEADEVVDRRSARVVEPAREGPEVARNAEQAEPDDEQPRHRARPERHVQRRLQPVLSGLRRAHVRADGHVHADEPRRRGEERPDEETNGRPPAQLVVEAEQEERHHRDDRDRRVLALQVRSRTLLHRPRDLLHPLGACRAAEQPDSQADAVGERDTGAQQREEHGVVTEEIHVLLLSQSSAASRTGARLGVSQACGAAG